MKIPSRPAGEAERLAALDSYEVLDTESEASFDGLTQLAAAILEVPIALVSLVDADRQWFKSRHGLDAAYTSRDVSFCGHVVAEASPLVVEDTLADARFADNPLVTGELRVRFYAGMPLCTPEGLVLGTLCGIDHVPRQPTAAQLRMLSLLAAQVVDQLEARKRRRLLTLERAAAEQSARRLSVLFDAMAEGVVVQNSDGLITHTNTSAERILGLTRDQIAGRRSVDPQWACVREDGTPFPGADHPAMVTLRTGEASRNVIMGVHKPGGQLTWISINSLPLESEAAAGRAALTTFHDITAIKEAAAVSERLARQEHLVTTGTLAAGVGHEINNPLTFILANLEFAIDELTAFELGRPSELVREVVAVLAEALVGAERVRKIVKGLRALARQDSDPVPTDVEGVVDASIDLARHEIRHKATVTKDVARLPRVLADESRLTQILVNLLVNAAQAFPTSDAARNRITVSAQETGGWIAISVADNGPGIAPDVQRRMFDPFFTTKPVGEGTGLGLSICRSIVKALGGELDVDSALGKGSTFRLRLPIASARAAAAEGAPSVPGPSRTRVLVIDDDPPLLKSIRRILEKDHDVVVLADAREALALIESGAEFHVILCDLVMPHLSGGALYERVLAARPPLAARFVFLTGGAVEGAGGAVPAGAPNARVEKPFDVQQLREIVRRVATAPALGRGHAQRKAG
ncbi:ATP-binding protein [soil metagenome]